MTWILEGENLQDHTHQHPKSIFFFFFYLGCGKIDTLLLKISTWVRMKWNSSVAVNEERWLQRTPREGVWPRETRPLLLEDFSGCQRSTVNTHPEEHGSNINFCSPMRDFQSAKVQTQSVISKPFQLEMTRSSVDLLHQVQMHEQPRQLEQTVKCQIITIKNQMCKQGRDSRHRRHKIRE